MIKKYLIDINQLTVHSRQPDLNVVKQMAVIKQFNIYKRIRVIK